MGDPRDNCSSCYGGITSAVSDPGGYAGWDWYTWSAKGAEGSGDATVGVTENGVDGDGLLVW